MTITISLQMPMENMGIEKERPSQRWGKKRLGHLGAKEKG